MKKVALLLGILLTTTTLFPAVVIGQRSSGTPSDPTGQMVAAVLGDTEDRWQEIFEKSNQQYRPPRLVLYTGITEHPCGGVARADQGPFYCPSDQRIYLDPSFFTDLETQFRACIGKTCELAMAFVIAREVGHHVQNVLGILPKVQQMKRGLDRQEANQLQARMDLQADCFAGLWLHHSDRTHKFLEPSHIAAVMESVAALGNDRLQKQASGKAVPETFMHGSSEQRVRWFTTGLKNGTVSSCNTFSAKSP
jgi:predicted metalloprotease